LAYTALLWRRIAPEKNYGFQQALWGLTKAYMSEVQINLVPLERETHTTLPTTEAARHLHRAQPTLTLWAMREDGPIRPAQVHGRLAWPVAELRCVLSLSEAA
jgi:hypothetical protein